MLKIFKKENSSTYVFTKSMGYVNRTINTIYYERQLLLKKNNRCRRNIIAAKISWFTVYDKILHPAETALSKQHNHIRAY